MAIYYKRFIYLFLIICCAISCSILKVIEINTKDYTGDIEILGNESFYLKFTLKIGENKDIRVKLFEYFGIKIAEFVIKRDSIIIETIIFDEYKKYIEGFFLKYNNTLCINYIISDIFDLKIFDKRYLPVCYIKIVNSEVSKEVIKVYSMEEKFVLSVSKNEIFEKNKESINLKFDNNECCVLNFSEVKKR